MKALHRHHPFRWTVVAATLIIAGFFLAPKVSDAGKAVDSLGVSALGWFGLGLALELVSLISFSFVTYALLPAENKPGFPAIFRLDLVTVALSHAVPAGSAAGTALGYGLLAEEGVGAVPASFAKVLQTLVSGLMLQVLLWAALGFEAMVHPATAPYLAISALGAAMVFSVVGFGWMVTRHGEALGRFVGRLLGWLPRLEAGSVSRFVIELCVRARSLGERPSLLFWVCVWSMGNWIFDLVSLWASLRAFGQPCNLVEITIAFSLAQVAGALPISPAGLGVIEGSLVPLLAGFGTPSSVAVLGVLLWRFFNFWLPLPLGGIAYLGIVRDRHRGLLPRYPKPEHDDRWAGAAT